MSYVNQPPTHWRSNVYFPANAQSYLSQYLGAGSNILSQDQFDQVSADYDEAYLAGTLFFDEERQNYRVPLTLTTPDGCPLFLCISPANRPGGLPWIVSFVTPPHVAKAIVEAAQAPAPEGSAPEQELPGSAEGTEEAPAAPGAVFTRLSDRDKLEIYNALLPVHPVGSTVAMSLAGSTLSSHGITPLRYGYSRMLQLAADMPEYFRVTSSQPQPDAPLVYYMTILPLPAEGTPPVFPVEDTATGETPPFAMTERTISFPLNNQERLARYINGEDDLGAERLTKEQHIELRNSYDAAVELGTLIYVPEYGVYRFPLSMSAKDGCALLATIKRSLNPSTPWYINAILKSKNPGVRPGDKLKKFAYLGDLDDFLRRLADHAEVEKWGFSEDSEDYSILWNYISYTFYRLEYEGKVYIDPNGEFAAFNTGLLSRRFGEDLMAYFEPNPLPGASSKWKFVCFCSGTNEAQGYERKAVSRLLPLHLELPKYFTSFFDTMFDPDCLLESNFMHIVRDNLYRFPMDWLHKQCDDHERTKAILAKIEDEIAICATLTEKDAITASHRRQKELFRQLGEAVTDDSDDAMCDLLMDMKDLFEGAVNRTVERCRRNFKLAVPCYFPTRNVMSMLLPISFSRAKNGAPTMVLVAERQKNGVYLGRTVLTMSMAYNDARLLCRPSSEWLSTAYIHEVNALDELDD